MSFRQNTAKGAFAITPSDTTEISAGALRIGGAGDLSVVGQDGNTVLIPSVLAGETIALSVTKVLSTGTSATLITGYKAQ